MKHDIKINKEYFHRVLDGTKTFEIRNNDRGYQKGDEVILWEINGMYETGRKAKAEIGFVIGYMQKENYVVFSLLNVESLE